MTVDSTAALARVAAAEGDDERGRRALPRAARRAGRDSEDHHYAIAGLRWGAVVLRRAAGEPRVRARVRRGAQPDRVAHRPAGRARGAGAARSARPRCWRATRRRRPSSSRARVELHRDLDMPFERAQIELRAGVALARGRRARARARAARRAPTAPRASSAPVRWPPRRRARSRALGESVGQRLGRRAAADADGAGLSRRELEVVRLRRRRRTNREIAAGARSSARAPSTCTCATSCASSTAARASRPPSAPASSGCWSAPDRKLRRTATFVQVMRTIAAVLTTLALAAPRPRGLVAGAGDLRRRRAAQRPRDDVRRDGAARRRLLAGQRRRRGRRRARSRSS